MTHHIPISARLDPSSVGMLKQEQRLGSEDSRVLGEDFIYDRIIITVRVIGQEEAGAVKQMGESLALGEHRARTQSEPPASLGP